MRIKRASVILCICLKSQHLVEMKRRNKYRLCDETTTSNPQHPRPVSTHPHNDNHWGFFSQHLPNVFSHLVGWSLLHIRLQISIWKVFSEYLSGPSTSSCLQAPWRREIPFLCLLQLHRKNWRTSPGSFLYILKTFHYYYCLLQL